MACETILIIEDDATLLRVLKDRFELNGYSVKMARDGKQGFELALRGNPDLIVLDIMLPQLNGYELCRLLRKDRIDVPIIMLTAKGEETDIVLGFNTGADDYVTKPFSVNELLARAEALLRRQRQNAPDVVRFGTYQLNKTSHKLFRDDTEIPLTPKEYQLLAFFARHPGRAFTRAEILRAVWTDDLLVTARSVDRCINTLRKKIERDPHHPQYITTVRDMGYRFETRESEPGSAEKA